jgi:LuxR family quorum sensing-dependent transcriptional regulator
MSDHFPTPPPDDRDAFEFIERLKSMTSVAEVVEAFREVLEPYEIEYFLISSWPQMGQPLSKVALFDAMPPGWVQYYDQEQLNLVDPIANAVFRLKGSYTFAEAVEGRRLTREERRAINAAERRGIKEGLIVPIYLRESSGFVMLAGDIPPLPMNARGRLHVMSVYTHMRIKALNDDDPDRDPDLISLREIEVLRWVSVGKTDSEIGKLMNISEHTAHKHVENIKRKLRASNRIEAVLKAYRTGQIIL